MIGSIVMLAKDPAASPFTIVPGFTQTTPSISYDKAQSLIRHELRCNGIIRTYLGKKLELTGRDKYVGCDSSRE